MRTADRLIHDLVRYLSPLFITISQTLSYQHHTHIINAPRRIPPHPRLATHTLRITLSRFLCHFFRRILHLPADMEIRRIQTWRWSQLRSTGLKARDGRPRSGFTAGRARSPAFVAPPTPATCERSWSRIGIFWVIIIDPRTVWTWTHLCCLPNSMTYT